MLGKPSRYSEIRQSVYVVTDRLIIFCVSSEKYFIDSRWDLLLKKEPRGNHVTLYIVHQVRYARILILFGSIIFELSNDFKNAEWHILLNKILSVRSVTVSSTSIVKKVRKKTSILSKTGRHFPIWDVSEGRLIVTCVKSYWEFHNRLFYGQFISHRVTT